MMWPKLDETKGKTIKDIHYGQTFVEFYFTDGTRVCVQLSVNAPVTTYIEVT